MPGLVLVTGANGVGKTNLLEALHVGAQGFSPRTRAEARLVRFGQPAARVSLRGDRAGSPTETEVTVRPGEPKAIRLDGAPAPAADALRSAIAALVFTPDRLAVVKGGPIVRRAYVDRMLGRLRPAQSELPAEYSRALAQRNAALRLARAGRSPVDAIAPWTAAVAELGTALDLARAAVAAELAPGFADRASSLGLEGATLAYDPQELTEATLEARLARDLERGTTGAGPHLRDVSLAAYGRDLRSFGSQGEQRAAVLALTLAEAALLAERRPAPPLLLLDDVLSELDAKRRRALLGALPSGGQTFVSATAADLLPGGVAPPAAEVRVTPGLAELAA